MSQRDPKSVEIGKEILPFEMGYLPEYFQKKAEVELKETSEHRQKMLKVLRYLIENDKDIKGSIFDDDYLLLNLRCRKFDAERALTHIKYTVNLRKNYKSIFENFIFEKIAASTRSKFFNFMPYRCQDGCAILLVKIDMWKPEELHIEDLKRTYVLFLGESLRDPMTQVNGFKVIFDFDYESNPLRLLKYCTPSNMNLLYHGTQECCPARFKEVHLLNASVIFKVIWAIMRVMLSSKLKGRVHIHDSPKKLLEYFPACAVPVEYGGELKDYDSTPWLKEAMSPEKLETLWGGKIADS